MSNAAPVYKKRVDPNKSTFGSERNIAKDHMKAAVIKEPKQISIEEIPIPSLRPNHVLVKIQGCGVCHSDFPVWEGREWFTYPREVGAPGHEAWGVVQQVDNSSDEYLVGKRIAMLSCHGYAEYDVVSKEQIILLPPFLNDKPFPGEPLGCAMNIFKRSQIRKGQKVAIIGVGFLGALLTQLIVNSGAEVLAISRRQYAREIAAQLGARTLSCEKREEIISTVNAWTNNQGCDRVIEAVGMQWALDCATEIIKIRGRMIIAGYHQDGMRSINMQKWNWRGIDVVNSHERDPQQYVSGINDAVDAVKQGQIDPFKLITHSASIDQLGELFELMETRPDGFLKGMVYL